VSSCNAMRERRRPCEGLPSAGLALLKTQIRGSGGRRGMDSTKRSMPKHRAHGACNHGLKNREGPCWMKWER